MRNYIESFLAYMKIEKMASPVTIYGYRIKLKKFFDFLSSKNISDLNPEVRLGLSTLILLNAKRLLKTPRAI